MESVEQDKWKMVMTRPSERLGILSKTLEGNLAWNSGDRPSASEPEASPAWDQKGAGLALCSY